MSERVQAVWRKVGLFSARRSKGPSRGTPSFGRAAGRRARSVVSPADEKWGGLKVDSNDGGEVDIDEGRAARRHAAQS